MLQLSVEARNARMNALKATFGASALLKIYAGALPIQSSLPDTQTLLASFSLPSVFLTDASNGSISMTGSWPTPTPLADGIASHFRLYDSTGTVCHLQGSITATGKGGDMTIQNTTVLQSRALTVTAFTLTDPNV